MISKAIQPVMPRFTVSPRSFEEFRNALHVGQIVQGRVVRELPEQTVLIRLLGYTVVAQTSLPLRRGERVMAAVHALEPRIHLRLAPAPADLAAPPDYPALLRQLDLTPEPLYLALVEQLIRYRAPVRKRTLKRLRAAIVQCLERDAALDGALLSRAAAMLLSLGLPVDPDTLGQAADALESRTEQTIDCVV
jgi:hypothetical protein